MSDSIAESNSFERNPSPVVLDHKYILFRLIQKGIRQIYQESVALRKDDPNTYYLVEMKSQEQYNSFVCDKELQKKCMIELIILNVFFSTTTTKDNIIWKLQVQENGERCGPALKLCFQHQNRKFQDQIFATPAVEAITALEKMHQVSIVHCYRKPKKFVTLHKGVQLLLTKLKFAQKYKLRQLLKINFNMHQHQINIQVKFIFRDKQSNNLNKGLINFYIGGRLFKTKQKKTKSDKINQVEFQKMNLITEKAFPSEKQQYNKFKILSFKYFINIKLRIKNLQILINKILLVVYHQKWKKMKSSQMIL